MQPITTITSIIVPLNRNHIDTDQIIPARFLKIIDKSGLSQHLFTDWRYLKDGSLNPDFILNQTPYNTGSILLAGDNFGCGSSREHAPWALTAYGFKAVIALSFADIFRNNALKNGLLPIVVTKEDHQEILDLIEELPVASITIDLPNQVIYLPGNHQIQFQIDTFSKHCLVEGKDDLGYILSFTNKIEQYEKTHHK